VRIRLDSEIGPEIVIQCGLPQGSPVSLILFILYIVLLFWLGVPVYRFGYTDNIALLAISKSLQDNYNSLQADAQEALQWEQTERIIFDPKKSELIHFTRQRADPLPASSPTVTTSTHIIQEATGLLHWLGVFFDKKLLFKPYICTLAAKALTVSNTLRSLDKTTRGILLIFL
jgi:hypothetical protein